MFKVYCTKNKIEIGRFSRQAFYNAQWGFVSAQCISSHLVSTGTKTLKYVHVIFTGLP